MTCCIHKKNQNLGIMKVMVKRSEESKRIYLKSTVLYHSNRVDSRNHTNSMNSRTKHLKESRDLEHEQYLFQYFTNIIF